ncbi:hypothetical protein SISNIDRAFT_481776 [Sistotremastrum niveocremeum HHB9708]|uniref:Nucleoporin NSP1 n=1 Tax=Sistotremastrum niveocremeum HHB9708 TaxID=1314777 RepID=A0A164ZNV6_9AGAM|nr:hypothetical protein SISNIDRAFT_481776 [Sistotremastrum niveocremeum HHB9708]
MAQPNFFPNFGKTNNQTPATPSSSTANSSGAPAAPAFGTAAGSAFGGFGGSPNAFGTSGSNTNIFGQKTQTSTDAPKPPVPLFGNTASNPPAFSLGGSATNPTSTNTPSAPTGTTGGTSTPGTNLFGGFGGGGGLFNTKPTESANATSSSTQGASNIFGSAPKPAENTNAASPAATFGSSNTPRANEPPKPSFAGFSMPSSANSAGTSTPSTNLFGVQTTTNPSKPEAPASNSPAEPKTNTTVPLFGSANLNKDTGKEKEPAPIPSFFGLGGAKPIETTKPSDTSTGQGTKDDAHKPSTSNPSGPSFGIPAPSADKPATQNATAPVPPPSLLRGKSIEEIVNRWDRELEAQVVEFNRVAGEVAAWDRTLIDNGTYLSKLYNEVQVAENSQSLIEQSLNSIDAQQQELEAVLSVYEKQAKEILDGSGGGLRALDTGPADAERDRNFTLAADLSTKLDDLTKSLLQMIESVNELSVSQGSGTEGKNDPLSQIADVLNEHLASLNWIDTSIQEMETEVQDVTQRTSSLSAQQNGPKGRGFGASRS